jgi:clan AA aspartic protease
VARQAQQHCDNDPMTSTPQNSASENEDGAIRDVREDQRRSHQLPSIRPVRQRRPPVGTTHVTVTVTNPAARDRAWQGEFLVHTGAIDSLVPRRHLEAIGVEPIGSRTYEMADGRRMQFDIGLAELELMNETVGGTVVFVDDDVEPLLGLTALESAGIEVDPRNQQLKRLPAVRLKALAAT